MPKVKLDAVPPHVVVPDTNILWDKDKKNPVSPDFDAFWERSSPLIPLCLAVPEVVLGELQFQQATSAIKCAVSVAEQMSELSGIAQSKYEAKLDHQKIKKQVADKIAKWVKGIGGSMVPTPVTSIDWKRMVQDAVWRTAPFTFDPKDKDNEKGFRDALILETLVSICDENKDGAANVVFICNDYLLRSSAEQRLKHNKKMLAFESIPDFESYIKLTQQQLTDKFVKAIQTHARSKFFSADDDSVIYRRENIRRVIKEKFADDFDLPKNSVPELGLLGGALYRWEIEDEKWWIRATQFDELIRPREYHWVSRVTVARLLAGGPPRGGLSLAFSPPQHNVQLLNFDVKWKANVKADGRFHDTSVIDIVKAENTQSPATEELMTQWELRRKDSANSSS